LKNVFVSQQDQEKDDATAEASKKDQEGDNKPETSTDAAKAPEEEKKEGGNGEGEKKEEEKKAEGEKKDEEGDKTVALVEPPKDDALASISKAAAAALASAAVKAKVGEKTKLCVCVGGGGGGSGNPFKPMLFVQIAHNGHFFTTDCVGSGNFLKISFKLDACYISNQYYSHQHPNFGFPQSVSQKR
jgi:hypothetical protein